MKEQKSMEQMLTKYAEAIPFPHQERVLARITAQHLAPRRPSRRLVVTLTACALLIFSGTVFADQIGHLLNQLQTNRLNAAQYDEIIAHDGVSISSSIRYDSGETPEDWGSMANAEWVRVPTIEEAQKRLGMTFPVPANLPQFDRLDHVEILKYETGIYARQVDLRFARQSMIIELFYVDGDSPADYTTTNNIEPITVGEYEGIIQRDDFGVELLWVQDEWLIKLFHPNEGTAMRVARSMQ